MKLTHALVTSVLAASSLASSVAGCCYSPGGSSSAPSTTVTVGAAPATTRGACDTISATSTCRDLAGDAFMLGEDFQRNLCVGTYTSGGACPTENVVGTCDEGGGQLRRYYATGVLPYTADTARADCTSMPGSTFR